MGSKTRLAASLDLTQVDGITVESRTPAKFRVAGFKAKDGRTEFEADGIDEILLADGRVLYQCVMRPNGCGRTFPSPLSVRSHLKVHAGKAAVARADLKIAELETALAEAQRENKGLVRMKENRDQKIMSLQADLRQAREDLTKLQADIAEEHARPDSLDRSAYDEAVKALGERANVIATALQGLVSDTGRLVGQFAPPDAEVLDKARRYDEMRRNLLGE